MPQALTWNMGTDNKTESRAQSAKPSAAQMANECSKVERWLYKTPLGLPVVPDV